MSENLGVWDKLTKAIVFLILLAVLVVVVCWYLPLFQQNERMRKEVHRLEVEAQQEEARARQLDSTLKTLSTDPKAVERMAREKLGYAKPGETVIRFEEPATSPPAHPR